MVRGVVFCKPQNHDWYAPATTPTVSTRVSATDKGFFRGFCSGAYSAKKVSSAAVSRAKKTLVFFISVR